MVNTVKIGQAVKGIHKMILNVKKSNFVIYLMCLLIAFILIGISMVIFSVNPQTLWDEAFLGIGCSMLPTVITAYLIDQSAEKREAKKLASLRISFSPQHALNHYNRKDIKDQDHDQ